MWRNSQVRALIQLVMIASVSSNSIFDLSNTEEEGNYKIKGVTLDEQLGYSVSGGGDVNGDGYGDVIMSAPYANTPAGVVYVLFGTANDEVNEDLNDIKNGFIIYGISEGDDFGCSIDISGDYNGDGYSDIMIGASESNKKGSIYIIYGRPSFNTSFHLDTDLNNNTGLTIEGMYEGGNAGFSVSNAGDFNGDGIDDMIIGAYGASPSGYTSSGQSYLIYGSTATLSSIIYLDNSIDGFNNGLNGFLINGPHNTSSYTGSSVSSAGDINNDGFADLIIGAQLTTKGSSYIIFGTDLTDSNDGIVNGVFELNKINGNNGFIIQGLGQDDYFGTSSSMLGDFNGDGIDDMIIGAYGASPNGKLEAGCSYIIFGSRDIADQGKFLDLNVLDGSNGFVLNGIYQGGYSGSVVSSAGDVDGDGYQDVLISAPYATPSPDLPSAGESYLVYGSSNMVASGVLELMSLYEDEGVGMVIRGQAAGDYSGSSLSSAGDYNGDGKSDIMIGASLASPSNQLSNAGIAYLVLNINATNQDDKNKYNQLIVYIIVASAGLFCILFVLCFQCTKAKKLIDYTILVESDMKKGHLDEPLVTEGIKSKTEG